MVRQLLLMAACGLLMSLLSLACEKAPAPPPRVSAKSPTDISAPPARPSTQALMNGQYKKVSLTPLPLSAQIPESWKVETVSGTDATFLQGPGIDGSTIQISLESGTPLTADQLKNVLSGSQRAATRDTTSQHHVTLRDLGETRVLEEQRTSADSTTDPAERQIDWKIIYFVPRDVVFAPYIVEVTGLTHTQFTQSKDLLRKIFDSISIEPGLAG